MAIERNLLLAINYGQLRQQKHTLLEFMDKTQMSSKQTEDLTGIIHLIDAIQDTAVAAGVTTEAEAFAL